MATDVTNERLAGTWNFAPVHSAATFSVKYLVAPFRGELTDVQAQLEDGRLTGAVKVASIAVKDENLAAHLQGPDFFDAEQHPEITFSSDRIDIDGDRVTLTGELTIKGVSQPVTATGTVNGPTEDFMGNVRLGLSLETDDRPHGLRRQLERPAAQGRQRARQRRHARRRARVPPRRRAMRILAISGIPAARLAQHGPPAGGSGPAAARGGARALRGPAGHPALRRRRRPRAARARAAPEARRSRTPTPSSSRPRSTTTRSRVS